MEDAFTTKNHQGMVASSPARGSVAGGGDTEQDCLRTTLGLFWSWGSPHMRTQPWAWLRVLFLYLCLAAVSSDGGRRNFEIPEPGPLD